MGVIKLNGKEYSGGGGSSTLAGLSDVNLNNLSNGQIIKYNSTTQKWENANESGGGGGGSTEYGYLSFNYTYGSNTTIYGNQITPNEDITIKGLRGFTTVDKSGSLRIGTTSSIIETIENVSFIGGQWTKADLSAPMTLTAGTTYIIQVVTSGGSGTIAYTQSSSSVAINSKITNTGVARHGDFPGNTETNVWVGVDIVISTGGGGTEVEANPTGTPTATLNTIRIGNTIYELPSGGGGSSVTGVISGYSERRYITSNFIVGEGTYQS